MMYNQKKYCTAINFAMCFLEQKMLQIPGEFALYHNLTNWGKGAWGDLHTGVLAKVPEEE